MEDRDENMSVRVHLIMGIRVQPNPKLRGLTQRVGLSHLRIMYVIL